MAGFQHFGDCLTLPGNADLSAKRACAAKVVNNGGVANWGLAGAGDRVHGIITEGLAAGYGSTVQLRGVAEVILGGNVVPADYVKSDANGHAITTVTATDHIFGVCIEGGANTDTGAILLFLGGIAY